MRIQNIIARKRDGQALSDAEIDVFVQGYTRGDVPDYQASAWLMAVYLRGMDGTETAALTRSMAQSGQMMDLSDLPRKKPTLDKHSTGGVGDKTSLVVVPILAACGIQVCKMSGRGLGHTGGTLDKLESLSGFRVDLSPDEMKSIVAGVGACLAGQTGDLAPADKKLYALRDATATVGSLPLIVSSILSKKLAGGAENFLFDVKVGNGALMKSEAEARQLAQALVDGAKANGRRAVAVLSDMSQPLGYSIGNATEIAEAVHTLTPDSSPARVSSRFYELCVRLATEGLLLAGIATDEDTAQAKVEDALKSKAALGVLREIVAAQGGDVRQIDDVERLPQAAYRRHVAAIQAGWVTAINAEALGNIVVGLGGGRARKEDTVDPSVGVSVRVAVGDRVEQDNALAVVYAANEGDARRAEEQVQAAFQIGSEPVAAPPLILDIIR